ncbi:MAG: hypothetical protein Ct9H300mP8_08270 [Gammaproteobacteria bacterium]|nr:MAG: hypothetical protein Ct9H300mP8_08270 [Gammaproteobacteria bacterium]
MPRALCQRCRGSCSLGSRGRLDLGILYYFVNPLTALLNLASWVGYGLVYTLYFKTSDATEHRYWGVVWRCAAPFWMGGCHE